MTPPTPPRRVYVDLVGDQFHVEHVELLERAASLGDEVVVGVLSDESVTRTGYRPVDPPEVRQVVLAATRVVSEVILEAPFVADEAFLDEHRLDVVALADDYDDPERRRAFSALEGSGRGVRVPWDERAAIASRLEQLATRATTSRLDRIETELLRLSCGQEAALEGLGALAAVRFADPTLIRGKKPSAEAWADAVGVAAAEQLDLAAPTRHATAAARPWITRAAAWAPRGTRVVLLGDYAESVGWALAHSHEVTILLPGTSPGVPEADVRFLPPEATPPRMIGCAWTDLGHALPSCDTLVITDAAAALYLLRRRPLLWKLCERVDDAVILEAPLSPTERNFFSSRDGAFYCSDVWVRAALHFVRFMEVVNLLTIVSGLPQTTGACRQRVSRFTRRKNIAHVGKVRYLDGTPAERIKAKIGTPIRRVYLARKRMLSDADLAFARGERGAP